MFIREILQGLILKTLSIDRESEHILRMIRAHASQDAHILDVGCGYGRNMSMLVENGFINIIGVEKNEHIVESMRKKGYVCMLPDEFNAGHTKYDLILLSHIIEHFEPNLLLNFMDHYLDRLVAGGHLIIATPLMSSYFYEDFDHVKPYLPSGIIAVFGNNQAQVQYYARNKLRLIDLWFRRGPYKFIFSKCLYVRNRKTVIIRLINLVAAICFRASFGAIGKADGWVGIFKKL